MSEISLSLSESKEQVEAAVRLQKASVLAKETAQQALEGMDSGATLETLAQQHRLEIETAKFTAATRFLPKLGENLEFRKAALRLSLSPFRFSSVTILITLSMVLFNWPVISEPAWQTEPVTKLNTKPMTTKNIRIFFRFISATVQKAREPPIQAADTLSNIGNSIKFSGLRIPPNY